MERRPVTPACHRSAIILPMNFFPNMKLPVSSIAAAMLAVATSVPLAAQGVDDTLVTVGTTQKVDDIIHSYLLWQPGDATATFGKRFSINRKDGPPGAASPFVRLGIQTLHSSPNTIRAMLELGAVVDRNHAAAATRIDALYRDSLYQSGDAPAAPADPNLDAAGKLSYLIHSAATDPRVLSRLFFLGRAHPGVMMALGHGYHIPVAPGVHTFEIREVDLADNDIRVVGRVTMDAENPVIPAAPASPVRVLHPLNPEDQHTISPKDHLNARLRWGVPTALRDQLPHTFGFDVFRVKKAAAEALGWHTTPPSPEKMLDALDATAADDPDPDISQANALPILVGDLLTPAEAADPNDTERIDFADDGIWHTGPDDRPARRPYADGEAFYFFVAARTITGRPGNISTGTLVVMCDRLPPAPPVVDAVLSQFVAPNNPAQWAAEGQGGSQFLQVRLRQLPSAPAEDTATGYYIYRWDTPQEYLSHLGNPLTGRIGYVAHVPGETFITFDDNGPGAPTHDTHPDRSVWYTARAVGYSACPEEVLSGHSGPQPGFLRDFVAPDAPTGDFLICRHIPQAFFDRRIPGKPGDIDLPEDFRGIIIDANRLNDIIVAADIRVDIWLENQSYLTVHARRHQFRKSDLIRVNLPYPEPTAKGGLIRLTVRAVTAHGLVSEPAVHVISEIQEPAPYARYPFNLTAEQQCRAISTVPDPRPIHEASNPDGSVNPITGSISFLPAQRVREWRVYRRVGSDAPLTLVEQKEGENLPTLDTWADPNMPAASGARVCYYLQTLDQNANPSPLEFLGCTEVVNPDLPTPMLAPAKIIGDDGGDNMIVALEWFCDPVGVERFEVLIAREGGGTPDPGGLSQLLSIEAVAMDDSADFDDLSFYRYQTARVTGPAMGDGPQFSVNLTLPADTPHYFSIVACGPGEPETRASGSASNITSARWVTEAAGPQPVIPWPVRPLPPAFDHRQPIESYTTGEGPLWPVVLPSEFGRPTSILVGVTRHPLLSDSLGTFGTLASPDPPENYLFQVRDNRNSAASLAPLMPFMLYRYQLPSDLYPDARANIVQCTPLIDRMSWRRVEDDKGGRAFEIRDPYFHFFEGRGQTPFNLPVSGGWDDVNLPELGPPLAVSPPPPYLEEATGFIFLNDLLPVAVGAKYRYLLVQFDDRGEIKRVIPLEPVQH